MKKTCGMNARAVSLNVRAGQSRPTTPLVYLEVLVYLVEHPESVPTHDFRARGPCPYVHV